MSRYALYCFDSYSHFGNVFCAWDAWVHFVNFVHEVHEVQSSTRNAVAAVAVAAVASAVQPAAVPEPVPVSRMTSRQVDKCHENSELLGNSSGSSYPSKILNLWCPDRGIWHFKMELKDHQDGIMY